MRKFYLENEYAQRYALHQPGKVFFGNISGLGASSDARYIPVGDAFLRDYMKVAQQPVVGTLYFLRGQNQYASLREFVDFVYSAKSLKLIYVPGTGEDIEYARDIDTTAIAKGEIDADKVLRAPVEFKCKTLYYNARQTTFVVETSEGERIYNYQYPTRYNDYAHRTMAFNNTGHVEAPIEAEIYGFSQSPRIEILQNGVVVKRVEFPVQVNAGEKLLYSSKDGDLYAYIEDGNGNQTNVSGSLNLDNDNFFKLPIGQCEIRVSSSFGVINKVIIRTYKMYKVV